MRDNGMRTAVYVAAIPTDAEIETVYPPMRQAEIDRCSNERVRLEKYFAWRLLELAVRENLGISMDSLSFIKRDNGKWCADKCFFSISHSDGAVAVAVSDRNIGVDVEVIRRRREGIEKRILTPDEESELYRLDAEGATEYIIRKWSEKESIFKTMDWKGFDPLKIETARFSVGSRTVELNGKRYILSVCSEKLENIYYSLDTEI